MRILRIPDGQSRSEVFMKFLKNNGKNFNELNVDGINELSKLLRAQFCSNLKKHFTIFEDDEIIILKTIFNSIKILKFGVVMEKELLEIVAKYSSQKFL